MKVMNSVELAAYFLSWAFNSFLFVFAFARSCWIGRTSLPF